MSSCCQADEILKAYQLDDAEVTSVNLSENETCRIDAADGEKLIWRRYRRGSRSITQIEAELDWMESILGETEISVPQVIRATDGRRIVVDSEGGQHVLFSFLAGEAPPEDDLVPWFARLGAVSAKLHAHGRCHMPATSPRPTYDFAALVGPNALWGQWQDAPGLRSSDIELANKTLAAVGNNLAVLGSESRCLIHGDLRLANLLVDGNKLHVIDFDDCGHGWRLFDLATALSLIEEAEDAPAAAASWLDSYEMIEAIPAAERAAVADLVMLRRIQVMAWFASHPDTELTREYAEPTIAATLAAADAHLAGRSRFTQ